MNKVEFILIHYYDEYDDVIRGIIIPTANIDNVAEHKPKENKDKIDKVVSSILYTKSGSTYWITETIFTVFKRMVGLEVQPIIPEEYFKD